MRYAYAITAALLLGGTTLALTSHPTSVIAQTGGAAAVVPRGGGAPASFADMVQTLQPAVVNISTRQRVQVQNPFAGTPLDELFGGGRGSDGEDGGGQTRQAQSLGSGFIVSADGYIVTNNHVVAPGAQGARVDSITVTLPDRTEYEATLVGADARSDLAVLKINAPRPLPFVRFGDSAAARVGDWVIAIGNPFGLGSTVTAGIISALHRSGLSGIERFIQTDASINQGNSGGPMFNMNGEVIGINSQILSPTGGNVGIGFAIPAEQAVPIIETLRQGQAVRRGYLGIQISPLSDDMAESLGMQHNRGELVQAVEPGKGAEKAGIRAGDVIVKVNDVEVTPDETLSYIVARLPIGSTVPIELIRGGRRMTVRAAIGERPPEEELAAFGRDSDQALPTPNERTEREAAQQLLGLAVQTLTPTIARQLGLEADVRGIVIAAIDPASDAAAKGLRRGDVIMQANGRPVTSPDALGQIAQEAKDAGRNAVMLQVVRRGIQPTFIAVRLRD